MMPKLMNCVMAEILTTKENINVFRGDSKTIEKTLSDEDGVIVDLTGAELRFSVKIDRFLLDADALISKDSIVPDGITITDATGGKFKVDIDAADTGLEIRDFEYDIQLKDSGGKVTTIFTGVFTIEQDVTKAS